MKKFLKVVAVLAVLSIVYYGYKDLKSRASEKAEVKTADSVAVKNDTTKVVVVDTISSKTSVK